MQPAAILLLTLILCSAAVDAGAAVVWTFGTEYSGSGGTLSGPVVVTLEHGGSPGSVTVHIDATALDGTLSEYISGLYLNLDPAFDPMGLSAGTDGSSLDPVTWGAATDSFRVAGAGLFDLHIGWANHAFTAGATDAVTFSLTGLTEAALNRLGAPGPGREAEPYVAVLRARSLGADGDASGWLFPRATSIAIPEPGTLTLLGAGLLILAALRPRREEGASERAAGRS